MQSSGSLCSINWAITMRPCCNRVDFVVIFSDIELIVYCYDKKSTCIMILPESSKHIPNKVNANVFFENKSV